MKPPTSGGFFISKMPTYDERIKRGFNLYQAAHGDDTPLESFVDDLEKMTPPTFTDEEIPTTNNIPDVDDDKVTVLPVVVFVLSAEEYAALCEGDEN